MDRRFRESAARTNARFNAVDARFNAVDGRFDRLEHQFGLMLAKMDSIGDKLDQNLKRINPKVDHCLNVLHEHEERIKKIERPSSPSQEGAPPQ